MSAAMVASILWKAQITTTELALLRTDRSSGSTDLRIGCSAQFARGSDHVGERRPNLLPFARF